MPKTRLLIAATLMLAACDTHSPQTGNTEAPVRDIDEGSDEEQQSEPATPKAETPPPPGTPASNSIPAAFRGRWGMVPGDCGPDAAIAKGLMVIDAEKLRFYESVAKPTVVTWPTPTRVEGRFAFSGEGMDWDKDMAIEVQGNGDTLVRSEKDPAASYRYMRCRG